MDQRELDNRFDYHRPDDQRARAHERVRTYLRQMAEEFNQSLPESDEKKTAINKLEEAMFWANAAIARQEPPVTVTSGWQMDEDYSRSRPVPADHGSDTITSQPRAGWIPPSTSFGIGDAG